MYHFLEGWDYIDALYFSVITLTTVGYGDFSPQTMGGKLFTIFYIFIGLGMILSFLHTVFDHFNQERQQYKSLRKNRKGLIKSKFIKPFLFIGRKKDYLLPLLDFKK